MSWDLGPGPGDHENGPEWGPRVAVAILVFVAFIGILAYCNARGGV